MTELMDFLLDKHFQSLFHISDIHIRNGEERFEEFIEVFKNLGLTIKNHKKYSEEASLVIITGDILDKGLHMTAHAIQLLKILIDTLTNLANTIIIPGNHDDKKDVGFSKLDSLSYRNGPSHVSFPKCSALARKYIMQA